MDAFLASQDTSAPAGDQTPQSDTPAMDAFLNNAQHDTLGQNVLTAGEGLASGVIGAAAPALEVASGLTTGADIRARKEASPIIHGAGEATGFIGSMFAPEVKGLTSLGSVVGNIGEHAASLLPEATSAISKIAATGVKGGAEMAALAGSDELSKMVTGDPNQTLGTAAVNVGLSGILGGAGGAAIGAVSPLFSKASNLIGIQKLASDFMGETKAIQEAGDPAANIVKEINGRIQESDAVANSGLKRDLVKQLVADVTPEQVGEHVSHIANVLDSAPKSIQGEGIFQNEVNNWKQIVTPTRDLISLAPKYTPTPDQVFSATENLKRQLHEWGQYDKALVPVAERPFRDAARSLATSLKNSLEDSDVWNAAGDAQKSYNAAAAPLYDIQKEFLGKFASKEQGDRVADPNKIQSYLNQVDKSKAGLKDNYVRNYLDQTQKAADAINKGYIDAGLAAPAESTLNPTPSLNHVLNTPVTPGVALARWANKNGARLAGNAVGEAGAGVVGGGLGALVGHPLVGAWMGERVLSPVFSAFAKPLAETAINSEAAKGTMNYLGDVVKGQGTLKSAVGNFFKSGAEVIGKDLIPDQESRNKLEKSISSFQKPENALNVASGLSHYLPDHAQAAAATAATASNYLQSLKPNPQPATPFDRNPPVDKTQLAKYNRALDVAQQPLMALKYAKEGKLLPQDVQTLQTVYPGLHSAIVNKLTSQMIADKAQGKSIPYAQRTSLSLLMGTPLDSTQTPQAMQAVIMSQGTQQAMQQLGGKSQKKASNVELKQIDKFNQLVATPLQARQIDKRD